MPPGQLNDTDFCYCFSYIKAICHFNVREQLMLRCDILYTADIYLIINLYHDVIF